ncbi:hypothetical protein RY972_15950 [Aeromonas allosaccharophila]|uniref:DUF7661 domain-containing protein n=1 Tax=Aeromonas allosaccharophila TaxID=656 RepID=A0ABZ0F7H5_9GAMM|nr:hypothetical protein [Aeromonas allosaccharophila]WOE65532.1 hypothetical protein RY972_15950 [Aeromonas allosaccharophila]
MMIFSVFGRLVGVKREGEQWLLFNVSLPERKYSRIRDVIIPDFLTEDEIPRWLDDIYHEAASATSSNWDTHLLEQPTIGPQQAP